MSKPQPDPDMIRAAVRVLYGELSEDNVAEIRAFDAPYGYMGSKRTPCGYFSDVDSLVAGAVDINTKNGGGTAFITLNPVDVDLLSRYENYVDEHAPYGMTEDVDVPRRRWFLVDCDPERKRGISANETEKAYAWEVVEQIAAALSARGWPAPVWADSGNGYHLLYHVDLPGDDEDLLRQCLRSLHEQFTVPDKVKVDISVHNPARIVKLYGVVAMKGSNTKTRPHRVSQILREPKPGEPFGGAEIVPTELLQALADEGESEPEKKPKDTRRKLSAPRAVSKQRAKGQKHSVTDPVLEAFLERNGLEWETSRAKKNGFSVYKLVRCPFCGEENDGRAVVGRTAGLDSGAYFRCHGDRCATAGNPDWTALTVLVGDNLAGNDPNTAGTRTSGQATTYVESDGWPEPLPFDAVSLPEFPVKTLPDWLRAWVTEQTEATQVPVDLPAMLVLGVLSTIFGGKVRVRINESWSEPVNLFGVPVMPPGDRKSGNFSAATEPLRAFEQSEGERLRERVADAEQRERILKGKLKHLESKAAKGKTVDERESATADAVATQRELEHHQETAPRIPRLYVDDATPEALTTLLAEHGGRMAVMSAEGHIFGIMAGLYSRGVPNYDVFLKGHAGDTIKVDRVTRGAEHIDNPALTLVLTIQPEVLRQVGEQRSMRGKGLLARFLFVLPKSRSGLRDVDAKPMSAATADDYRDKMGQLVRRAAESEPREIGLTADAAAELRDFAIWLEPHLGVDGDLSHMTDWANKLAGAAVRIAALLRGARSFVGGMAVDLGQPIERADMRNALEIAHYLLEHAQAAFNEVSSRSPVAAARKLWAKIKEPPRFTRRRELHRKVQRAYQRAGDLDAPLQLLDELGYIRLEGSGKAWEINPRAVRP